MCVSWQLKKQEDESCAKANQAYTAYKNQLQSTNATRQEFFQSQLPSNILALKGLDDECCTAIRYQLARYAYIYEEALVLDGLALDNDEGNGLRSLTEKIDHGVDTEELVKEFSRKAQPLNKEDIQYKEYVMVKYEEINIANNNNGKNNSYAIVSSGNEYIKTKSCLWSITDQADGKRQERDTTYSD